MQSGTPAVLFRFRESEFKKQGLVKQFRGRTIEIGTPTEVMVPPGGQVQVMLPTTFRAQNPERWKLVMTPAHHRLTLTCEYDGGQMMAVRNRMRRTAVRFHAGDVVARLTVARKVSPDVYVMPDNHDEWVSWNLAEGEQEFW